MQNNLACVWRLYWWTRPHGRAFELLMCTLKVRVWGPGGCVCANMPASLACVCNPGSVESQPLPRALVPRSPQARLLNTKPSIDLGACKLRCGDTKVVDIKEIHGV